MSSSRRVRKIRSAISPRFATRTLANTIRILSTDGPRRPTDRRTRALGADRGRALRDLVPEPQLLGDRGVLCRDGNGLLRRQGRPADRPFLTTGIAPRPGRGQAARDGDADRPARTGRVPRLDGGGDRRTRAPHLRAAPGGAGARRRDRGPRSGEAEDVVAGDRRWCRRPRGRRSLEQFGRLVGAPGRTRPDLELRARLRALGTAAAPQPGSRLAVGLAYNVAVNAVYAGAA